MAAKNSAGETKARLVQGANSRGWESQVTSAVKDLTGIEARGIAEFARDHAAAFGKR